MLRMGSLNLPVHTALNVTLRDCSKRFGVGEVGQSRKGRLSVLEPLIKGGSFNFQLPMEVGQPV